MKIRLPDGSKKETKKGTTLGELAYSIGPRLGKAAIVGSLDGEMGDLFEPIEKSASVVFFTFDSPEGREAFWHSTAHLMMQAIQRLHKNVRNTIGPAVENGFYYDFDSKYAFSEGDFEAIEQEMQKIVKEDLEVERVILTRKKAEEFFKGNNYKLEILKEISGNKIQFYKQGEFMDLCRGGHVPRTGMLKAFKLTKVAGAYWRGDSKNAMLQRLYGISFPETKQLKTYLKLQEEAEKRDHRKLGQRLDLFSFHEEGPGFPFFHPKGMVIYRELEKFLLEEKLKQRYHEVRTPQILDNKLWHQSGHWDHYKENMYLTEVDENEYAVKPMNCPGNTKIYASRPRSYRELPLRLSEFGHVHRHELSGVLHGLMRVRAFTQDDNHTYVTPEQIESEIKGILELVETVYKTFGFEYTIRLSTKPEKSMGSDELWERAEKALTNVLKKTKVPFSLNPGDGAFYGPKIDFVMRDSLGREWQTGTIQLDIQMPERFGLEYIGEDNSPHRPVMIHLAILGSMERFMAVLIEHFGGAFPVWLSPVQAKIITVADRHNKYAEMISGMMMENGIRFEMDSRAERVEAKVRDATLEKVPYIITIGDKEVEKGTLAIRTRDGKVKFGVKAESFIKKIGKEIEERL